MNARDARDSRVHVIGAGLAGLSAAVRLAQAGKAVTVYEAAPKPGGRCRSFIDAQLGTTIDNGSHLMLSGNTDILAYLKSIGSLDQIKTLDRAQFNFSDVRDNSSWCVDLGMGRGMGSLIGWLFDATRRPPTASPLDLIRDVAAVLMGKGKTVAACLDTASLRFELFWEPLCIGILNASARQASAELLANVLKETVLKGGTMARPMLTRHGLSAALIDPAIHTLQALGADLKFGERVQGIKTHGSRVVELTGGQKFGEHDQVVLAVPSFVAESFDLPLTVPLGTRAILNVHYASKIDHPLALHGVVGGGAQWVFTRGKVVSVTVSDAGKWLDMQAPEIAKSFWPEVQKVLGTSDAMGPFRVIKERRATFDQSPESLKSRPPTRTHLDNLVLAGDWTDTGIPATIEGAVRSGRKAAEAILT